jgi:hypothetical protein
MLHHWNDWIAAAGLALEAQGVIAMRLAKIAAGGPDAEAECLLMVKEKFAAASAAQAVATAALVSGESVESAARLALAPIQCRVHANHCRLSQE